ncbi:MAG: hypothetical protein AB7H80_11650, partial [Candidatus Kapaibacterium sp.]
PHTLLSQSEKTNLDNLIEQILGEEEIEDGILDLIERYRTEPLQLYTASAEELSELPGISPQTAVRILEFLKKEQPDSFDDFSSLNWLSVEVLQVLKALTILGTPPPSPELHLQFRGRVSRDVEERRGYSENQYRVLVGQTSPGSVPILDTVVIGSRYTGSPEGLLSRILVSYGEYSGGITFEKDPGEPLSFTDTINYTYDNYERIESEVNSEDLKVKTRLGSFVSLHARAELTPATLFLGDYTAGFGQGLVFGKSFSGRKGTSATGDPYNSGGGLRSYRSTGERYFFRGAGIEVHQGDWLPRWLAASAFVSSRSLDGSIVESLNVDGDSINSVSSIREDGLRRTRTELRRSATLSERVIGGHIDGFFVGGRVGLTLGRGDYSFPLISSGVDTPLQDHWTLASLDADFSFSSGRVFGELAVDESGDVSIVSGTALRLPGADLTLSTRSYHPDFFSPYGVAFGESPANPRNERGIYLGIRTRLFPRTFLSLYGDLYRIPDGNQANLLPITGAEGGASLNYGVTRELDVEVRLRGEGDQEMALTEDASGREVRKVVDRTIASGRATARWKPRGGSVELRARVEGKVVRFSEIVPDQNGVLTYLDFRWKLLQNFHFGSRIILFDVDGSDARLYEFEQDLPGRVANIALSGEGGRFYLLAAWKPTPSFAFTLRYDETWYADREMISAGSLQEIQGNVSGKWSLQVDGEF